MEKRVAGPLEMDVVVVAGMSGAGKTVAIKALEDCGYYSVDHLPADTLSTVLSSLRDKGESKIAVGLDIWDSGFLEGAGPEGWRAPFSGLGKLRLILLEAAAPALVRRYGETRRKHPLTREGLSLEQAIDAERSILQRHKREGHSVDTSEMSPNTLKAYVKSFLNLKTSQMDICIESFGFKHGAPTTCELIFDVRCLPNPYYESALRPLSGLDAPVQRFFEAHPKPLKMAQQIANFIAEWKPDYERDHRSYLTVGVGCTGGQHRSVFVAELARDLLAQMGVESRAKHREQHRWARTHPHEHEPLALAPPPARGTPGSAQAPIPIRPSAVPPLAADKLGGRRQDFGLSPPDFPRGLGPR